MQPIHRQSRLLKQNPAIGGAEIASGTPSGGDLLMYDATTGTWLMGQTLTGTYTFTEALTVQANQISVGETGTGTGGNIRHVDDSGTERWLTGILGGAGEQEWSVYNLVAAREDIRINTSGTVFTDGVLWINQGNASSSPLRLVAADTIGDNYISFYESDAATRKGFIGYAATTTDPFYIRNEETGNDILYQVTGGGHHKWYVDGGTIPVFEVTNDPIVRIYDATGVDYVDQYHTGLDFYYDYTNTRYEYHQGLTSGAIYLGGAWMRMYDSANVDYLQFNVASNIAQFTPSGTTHVDWYNSNIHRFRDGSTIRVYDTTDADYLQFQHNGTDALMDFANTTWFRIGNTTPPTSGTLFRGGQDVRVYDATDNDYISFTHDGTDATIHCHQTTQLNFTGPSSGINFGPMTVTTANSASTEVGYKGAPINAKTANYTLVLGDAGETIRCLGAGITITIPPNSSVAFPTGTIIWFMNIDSTNNVTIAEGTGVGIIGQGASVAGSMTLTPYTLIAMIKYTTDGWTYIGTP